MGTSLFEQFGAAALETGVISDQHSGWGDLSRSHPLAADAAISYLEFGVMTDDTLKDDASITGDAFTGAGRLVGSYSDQPLSMNGRFDGVTKFLGWAFGMSPKVTRVARFKTTTAIDPMNPNKPSVGSVYKDAAGTPNSYTFQEINFGRGLDGENFTVLQFATTGATDFSTCPTSGTLTKFSGSGPTTIDYTLGSATLYEHFFEVDKRTVSTRIFTTAEKTALAGCQVNGDQRTGLMTLAKSFEDFIAVVPNAMAKGWKMSMTPGDFAKWEFGYLARKVYRQAAGSTVGNTVVNDIDFNPTCAASDINGIIPHLSTRVFVYDATLSRGDSWTEDDGFTDISVGFETPLQRLQDTKSGAFLTKPVLEGKYKFTASLTTSIAEGTTWQDRKDSKVPLAMDIQMMDGLYVHNIWIKNATVVKAGYNNDPVAKEPVELSVNRQCGATHSFTSSMHGVSETQNSPIIYRVVSTEQYNAVTSRTLAGALRPSSNY